jgi:hypothetical protein
MSVDGRVDHALRDCVFGCGVRHDQRAMVRISRDVITHFTAT